MKEIVKKFNNLIEKTIFKVKNKTNNKFRISNFNKYFITFIGLLFFYLFYLLIPLLYEKSWVQNSIETKIFSDFKLNISTSADISYRILPAPHFLIKNSKILLGENKSTKSIANVKDLKVFLSQKNLLNKKKINFKKITIDNANFFLLRNQLKILNDFSNSQFPNKKIEINNSNVFFKDNLNEIITIIKINKATLFFDDRTQLNLFNLKGNAFGVLLTFDFMGKNDTVISKKINLEAKSLKLDIFNESIIEKNKTNSGKNIISFLNSSIKTKYNVKKKSITFESDNSRLSNSIIDYSGELSLNPFDLNLNIDLGKHKVSKLFNLKSTFKEFIKTELLFNDNLSLDISVLARTNAIDEIFHSAKINFNVVDGKINVDNKIFVNDSIGFMRLSNSDLFFKNNELILNTDILINIKDSESLFSFLNTNKKYRKEIKNILINLDYDFSNNQIKFNNVSVDNNEISDQFLNALFYIYEG